MLLELYHLKFVKYIQGLRHLFNTGQGIVMEKSPYNNYCYVEAAYRQGWIDKESRKYYYIIQSVTLEELMKPHLIVYLDAPTSVVQANLAKRGETGPVYSNTEYMNHWSDLNKKDYLKEASIGSEVLVYDWSEGGDAEVVVEDIEALNLDYYDKYSKKHEDWRLHTEDAYWVARRKYTMMMGPTLNGMKFPYFNATKMWKTPAENMEWQVLYSRVPGNKWLPGYNEELGDSNPLFAFGGWRFAMFSDGPWFKDSSVTGDTLDIDHEDRLRASRRAAGMKNWWYGFNKSGH
jgi:NADH dehydrogenase (ubiquinone) 1 alpha subcomplex subunit 10